MGRAMRNMAIHRMVRSAITGEPFPLFGDGSHVRDFTYVDDIVAANVLTATSDVADGSVFNVAGGGATTVTELLETVGAAVGRPVPLDRQDEQPGDVRETNGTTEAIRSATGWAPQVSLADGVRAEADWLRALL